MKVSTTTAPAGPGPRSTSQHVARLRDLSAQQWKSGLAAWLGWLFDGRDMPLHVLVAPPFVAELPGAADQKDPLVGNRSSLIQSATCASAWPDTVLPGASGADPRPAGRTGGPGRGAGNHPRHPP